MNVCERKYQGFSLLEMIVVIIIIAVLFSAAAYKLLPHRIAAEQIALSHSIAKLRVALSLEMTHYIASGNIKNLPRLIGTNPMSYLQHEPGNYIGESNSLDLAQIEPGQWYFDTGQGILVYRVRYADEFVTNLPGITRARFKILLQYADKNKNGHFDHTYDQVLGVKLAPLEPYSWRQTSDTTG